MAQRVTIIAPQYRARRELVGIKETFVHLRNLYLQECILCGGETRTIILLILTLLWPSNLYLPSTSNNCIMSRKDTYFKTIFSIELFIENNSSIFFINLNNFSNDRKI